MGTDEDDKTALAPELKEQVCSFIEALLAQDAASYEADYVQLLARVQNLVDRKRQMEGSKTDTRDVITEVVFSRLRRAMQQFLRGKEARDQQRAAEWAMGALYSMMTLTELARAFDQVLLQSAHSSNDFNFASRTDFLSLEEVLQMLAAGKHTGCLSLEKADNRLDIYLDNGRIAFLDGHHMIRRVIPAADSLHRREIPVAAVTEAEALRTASGRPVLLGLFDAGHFKQEELREVLRLFGREILFDFMITSEPFVFFFRRLEQLPQFVQEHELRLGVTSLLLEGSKRLDDWQHMRKLFPDSKAPIEPRADMFARMGDAHLDVHEIKLLSQINGETSPRALMPLLGLPLFDIYQILVRLAREGIIASPAGDAVVNSFQMSVAESMQEAFAALDANDDQVLRSNVLDQVLGGGDDDAEAEADDGLDHAERHSRRRGAARRSVLDRVFADGGDDDLDGLDDLAGLADAADDQGDAAGEGEGKLGRGFLKMLGKQRAE